MERLSESWFSGYDPCTLDPNELPRIGFDLLTYILNMQCDQVRGCKCHCLKARKLDSIRESSELQDSTQHGFGLSNKVKLQFKIYRITK